MQIIYIHVKYFMPLFTGSEAGLQASRYK